MRIYLAGPIENASDLGEGWRRAVTPLLTEAGYEVVDPTITEKKGLTEEEVRIVRSRPLSNTREVQEYRDIVGDRIVIPDLLEVRSCAAILCKWEAFSAGTSGELTFARWTRTPVYLVAEDIDDVPGWIIGCSTVIFRSMENAVNFLTVMASSGRAAGGD